MASLLKLYATLSFQLCMAICGKISPSQISKVDDEISNNNQDLLSFSRTCDVGISTCSSRPCNGRHWMPAGPTQRSWLKCRRSWWRVWAKNTHCDRSVKAKWKICRLTRRQRWKFHGVVPSTRRNRFKNFCTFSCLRNGCACNNWEQFEQGNCSTCKTTLWPNN